VSEYPGIDMAEFSYFCSSADSKGMVQALNEASQYFTEGHNMFIGDDHRFRTVGWDNVFETYCDNAFSILYGDDLLQHERLPTAACLSRKVVDAMGGIMCPGTLKHLYVDDYWLKLGHDAQIIHYLPDIIIEHCHPAAGKAEWDDRYRIISTEEYHNSDHQALAEYVNSDDYATLVQRILNGRS
jgi:hypothetical protein